MFLHLMEKKKTVPFRWLLDVGATYRVLLFLTVIHLFCLFQLLYRLYWCSFYAYWPTPRLHRLDLHNNNNNKTQTIWSHMGNDVFCYLKMKKKFRSNVCGELPFYSFILTNDITVQLLSRRGKCEGGWGGGPGLGVQASLSSTPTLSRKHEKKNCQVQILNNMVRLHKVLLPFYSNFVLFYQHYKALLYVYFLFFSWYFF